MISKRVSSDMTDRKLCSRIRCFCLFFAVVVVVFVVFQTFGSFPKEVIWSKQLRLLWHSDSENLPKYHSTGLSYAFFEKRDIFMKHCSCQNFSFSL